MVVPPRARRERALVDELHETARDLPLEVSFVSRPMNPIATITTDLLTPLGAYLRLRGMGRATWS